VGGVVHRGRLLLCRVGGCLDPGEERVQLAEDFSVLRRELLEEIFLEDLREILFLFSQLSFVMGLHGGLVESMLEEVDALLKPGT
jgi:hypothetical protein